MTCDTQTPKAHIVTGESMKRILAIALVLLATVPLSADDQQGEEVVSVPKSILTKEQAGKLAEYNFAKKVETYGKWVGVGHEVGVAVNEGLSAVTTQANSFASTPVGKWTMAVIVFKVVGKDIIGLLFAIGVIAVGLPAWIWSYRKYLPRQALGHESIGKDGTKTIYYSGSEVEGLDSWRLAHVGVLLFLILVAIFSTFGSC